MSAEGAKLQDACTPNLSGKRTELYHARYSLTEII